MVGNLLPMVGNYTVLYPIDKHSQLSTVCIVHGIVRIRYLHVEHAHVCSRVAETYRNYSNKWTSSVQK